MRFTRPLPLACVVVAALTALGCRDEPHSPEAPPDGVRPSAGVDFMGRVGIGDPIVPLNPEQHANFQAGKVLFDKEFTVEEGLGPIFNEPGCVTCHGNPTSGGNGVLVADPTSNRDRIVHTGIFEGGECNELAGPPFGPPPALGGPAFAGRLTDMLRDYLTTEFPDLDLNLEDRGLVIREGGEPIPEDAPFGVRNTPDLFGFGFLDAVLDTDIEAMADPGDADGDGISGRTSSANPAVAIGIARFGRKGEGPTLQAFNTAAFLFEQGLTSRLPSEGQFGATGIDVTDIDGKPGVDLDPAAGDRTIFLVTEFNRFLKPLAPRRGAFRDRDFLRGRVIFEDINCTGCHVPTLTTGPAGAYASPSHEAEGTAIPEILANRTIHAWTDLLLHDMGPDLADICRGNARPEEWRTEPLMGVGLLTRWLHDGRAKSLEEAILLHGGEATQSRDAFVELSDKDRAAVLRFLELL